MRWLLRRLSGGKAPSLPPPVPATCLVASPVFDPAAVPAPPPDPDQVLATQRLQLYRRNFPDLTWRQYMALLEERHRTLAGERAALEAKLAALLAVPRFKP